MEEQTVRWPAFFTRASDPSLAPAAGDPPPLPQAVRPASAASTSAIFDFIGHSIRWYGRPARRARASSRPAGRDHEVEVGRLVHGGDAQPPPLAVGEVVPADHAGHRHTVVVGVPRDVGDELALEGLMVGPALTGDDEPGRVEAAVEAEGAEHVVGAGDQRGAVDAPQGPGHASRRARTRGVPRVAGEPGRRRVQAPGQRRDLSGGRALLRCEDPRGILVRGDDVTQNRQFRRARAAALLERGQHTCPSVAGRGPAGGYEHLARAPAYGLGDELPGAVAARGQRGALVLCEQAEPGRLRHLDDGDAVGQQSQ